MSQPETFHPIQATISGRVGSERGLVTVYCEWDEAAKVWRGSRTLLKFEVEAPTLDGLLEKVGTLLGNAG